MASEPRTKPPVVPQRPWRYDHAPAAAEPVPVPKNAYPPAEGFMDQPAEGVGRVETIVSMRLRPGAGISVDYRGEVVVLDLDLSTVAEMPPNYDADIYTIIWDEETGETWKVKAVAGGTIPYHTHTISQVENLIDELQARPTDAPRDGVIYGRQDGFWVATGGAVEWADIENKPITFPPSLPIPLSGVDGLDAILADIDYDLTEHTTQIANLQIGQDALGIRMTAAEGDIAVLETTVAALDTEMDGKLSDAPADGKTYGRKNNTWEPAAGAAQISDTPPATADNATFWWDSDDGGLYIRYADVDTTQWVQVGGTEVVDSVPEAPADGHLYGRINETWAEIVAEVEEAPVDGGQYVRKDAAWALLDLPPDLVTEAPMDGQQYARQDGAWEPFTIPEPAPAVGLVDIGDAAPSAPLDKQLWWNSATGLLSIRYNDGNSAQWVGLNGSMAAAVVISDTPPAVTFPGMLWWESDTGELSIRYHDGDSEQWVSALGTDYTDVYSTTETPTGKVWIDGKPIYRKVINFGTLPVNGNKTVAHNITGLDWLVSIVGLTKSPTQFVPLPYPSISAAYNVSLQASPTHVIVTTSTADWSAYTTCYVILEYTRA